MLQGDIWPMISELNRSARASSDLVRFALLFSVLYSAFGVASPFLPTFLSSRAISPEQIGLIISLSTFVRIVSGPIAGRMADRLGARREILAACTLGAAVFALAFIPAHGFSLLLLIALAQAALLAPTTTLADALALRSAYADGNASARFEYGWVRGARQQISDLARRADESAGLKRGSSGAAEQAMRYKSVAEVSGGRRERELPWIAPSSAVDLLGSADTQRPRHLPSQEDGIAHLAPAPPVLAFQFRPKPVFAQTQLR
jgi:hypothetical protein